MINHYIQQDILSRLSQAPSLRFSDLKPQNLESNLFLYHLRQLIHDGYIEKIDRAYKLTSAGLTYIDSLSLTNTKPRKQPKILSIIILRDKSGAWLLGRRKVQPYINQLAFISGKQHFGETPEDHIQRELSEKTGLNLPLNRIGLTDIRIYQQNTLLTHILGHVYVGELNSNIVPKNTKQYSYEWHKSLDDLKDLMPATKELAQAAEGGEPFFLSISAEI